ncbi:MAG: sulfatase-like hydrolase/transferase [Aquabacterium sp.]|uniref:LTA synthase family protein n=1 Tax=Aquabacterium sp. TaxID=1872578 RepID=UPI002722391D|nr:alkaline phosphatase family protein [Aquabacterium sp.]MDO9003647.1 sulfatase-like hydrolase/transferase [Aquabacterium sp.]
MLHSRPSMLAPARLPLLVMLVWVGVFTALRLGLALLVGTASVPLTLWPGIFAKGLMFDLAVAAIAAAPVFAYEAMLPNRWRHQAWHRVLRTVWLWFALLLMLFGAASEVTFWIEFSTRFNFIAVDYLIYTQEVIGNIRQSYPIPAIVLGLAALSALLTLFLRRPLRLVNEQTLSWRQRAVLWVAAVALPAASLLLTNVDQMQGLGNAYADELSGNGLFTLAAAMRRNELDYDKFYRTMPQDQADAILKAMDVERQPLSEAIHPPAGEDPADDPLPFKRRPKNVVLISVESLSAEFMDTYGSTKHLMPRLDALAREGMMFEHVYATGTRTVRGLESLSLGTPPVPGQAIVRRPNNEHLATLGEILKPQGVNSFFFYGGYGYFDNMNAYFDANGYKVVDRTDIPKASVVFENVWGVADEVLFGHAAKTLTAESASGKPFFAHIMTTSNHRPYTYPDGRIDIKSPGGRDGAVKYTDYAIGKFIDDARSQPWFKDTLFIIIADHCASVAGKSKLPVAGYHIPLIFYAPDMVEPSVYKSTVSQLDLAPTIVEMMGYSGDDHFFGRPFFETDENPNRAFISNYQELGYLRDDVLTVLMPKRKVLAYKVDPITLATTPTEVNERLMNEAIAYYQTASRAFKEGALKMEPAKTH